MKCSTTKIPPAKMNNSAGKVSVKSSRLRKSQQKGEEICQVYFMQLRSGLIIEKKACYFRKETTKRHSPNSAEDYNEQNRLLATYQTRLERFGQSTRGFAFSAQGNTRTRDESSRILEFRRGSQLCSPGLLQVSEQLHTLQMERCVSLSTYNDQAITFVFSDGGYEIYIEDLRGKDEKDKVLFHYYNSQSPASETGDDVDGHKLMVRISPANNKNFLLHANNKEHSVELQKYENSLPDQTLFLLHTELGPSSCVSFECMNNPGLFIGVENNHLSLINLKDKTDHLIRENIRFKLS
ncbi:interleukin-33 isoform X1 [Pipistrellus kuhlii]|uniref:Interleukin-33 n=1 Tax=Pipistrellus kuhlii TaxID=59472 RepID=A0A7J7W3C1_PIPKU|nr:interleukin-33 isoform X1 [Pipistrellus kuhlii]XP_045436156.1 interleukin-33 isoform X1 [Pipistrellus kuhlii]XP_045436157.1 interleukin-33 isoform X1 [Pipistrellus kuhlii]KAF6331781.1 interleukin 33 [Pipistrellus kuhlii]